MFRCTSLCNLLAVATWQGYNLTPTAPGAGRWLVVCSSGLLASHPCLQAQPVLPASPLGLKDYEIAGSVGLALEFFQATTDLICSLMSLIELLP